MQTVSILDGTPARNRALLLQKTCMTSKHRRRFSITCFEGLSGSSGCSEICGACCSQLFGPSVLFSGRLAWTKGVYIVDLTGHESQFRSMKDKKSAAFVGLFPEARMLAHVLLAMMPAITSLGEDDTKQPPVAAEVFGAHLLCHSGVLTADCAATRCSYWQLAESTGVNLVCKDMCSQTDRSTDQNFASFRIAMQT